MWWPIFCLDDKRVLWVVTLCTTIPLGVGIKEQFMSVSSCSMICLLNSKVSPLFTIPKFNTCAQQCSALRSDDTSDAVRPKGCFKNGDLKRVTMCGVHDLRYRFITREKYHFFLEKVQIISKRTARLFWTDLKESREVHLKLFTRKKCHFCTPRPKVSTPS